jgi:hypothetical protein
MALEGNVRDFGLSEILQLIALQKKTGMLSISSDQTMVIYFREGQVISTRDRRRMADDPLKKYLIRYGFLNDEEISRIEQVQIETSLDLTDILISEKKFSDDEIRIIFAEQIQETIQEVLSWPKSQYKFMIGSQVLQGVTSFGSLKVEGLLMESMRRIDEFPELMRIFTTDDTVVKRLPKPKDAAIELDELEESIYALLEHEKSIGAIITKARMARFSTYEILKNLLEKGFLQIVDVPKLAEVTAETSAAETSAPTRRGLLPVFAAAGMLVFCLAFGEIAVPYVLPPGWGFVRRDAGRESNAANAASVAPTLAGIRSRLLEAAVREGLEEHLALNGAYPTSIETLVAKGYISRNVLGQADERGFSYRVGGGGKSYTLETSRP